MASFGQTLPPGGLNGLLRSYGLELRGWAGGITLRYAVAVVLLLSAAANEAVGRIKQALSGAMQAAQDTINRAMDANKKP